MMGCDRSQILVLKHVFVMNFLCNPLCLFASYLGLTLLLGESYLEAGGDHYLSP